MLFVTIVHQILVHILIIEYIFECYFVCFLLWFEWRTQSLLLSFVLLKTIIKNNLVNSATTYSLLIGIDNRYNLLTSISESSGIHIFDWIGLRNTIFDIWQIGFLGKILVFHFLPDKSDLIVSIILKILLVDWKVFIVFIFWTLEWKVDSVFEIIEFYFLIILV